MHRQFAQILGLCFLLLLIVPITAAQPASTDALWGRLVYVRTLEDGSRELVSHYAEGRVVVPIASTDCYAVSPSGLHIAVSSREVLTEIRIYSADTGELLLLQPWLSQWNAPCNFSWLSDTLLCLSRHIPPPQPDLEHDELDVITNTMTIQPNLPQPAPPDLPRMLVSDPYLSPIPGIPLYLPSSEAGMYAYVRCVNGEPGFEGCPGADQETVIYDAAESRTLVALVDTGAFLDYPELNTQLTWSPSGRYLIYLVVIDTKWVNIYDTVTEQYEATEGIDIIGFYADSTSPFYWSQDESLIAKWVRPLYGEAWHVSFYDRIGRSVTVDVHPFIRGFRDLIWSPDSRAVALAESDGDLQIVTVSGSTFTAADKVQRIITWDNLSYPASPGS